MADSSLVCVFSFFHCQKKKQKSLGLQKELKKILRHPQPRMKKTPPNPRGQTVFHPNAHAAALIFKFLFDRPFLIYIVKYFRFNNL